MLSLLEFREQELQHMIHMQVNVSIGQNLLIDILLCLMQLNSLLKDCEQQQVSAENLTHRSLSVLSQEPLTILLNTLKHASELRLL